MATTYPPPHFGVSFSSLFSDVKDTIKSIPTDPESIRKLLVQTQTQMEVKNANNQINNATATATATATTTKNVRPCIFKHPIHYLDASSKHELPPSIADDLELIDAKLDKFPNNPNNPSNPNNRKGLYSYVFNPATIFGRDYLNEWSKYYTTDTGFLKDTQRLLYNLNAGVVTQNFGDNDTAKTDRIFTDIDTRWKELRGSGDAAEFKERFSYVEVSFFDRLNRSPHFLQFLTMYNISSPLIALATPIFVLILPFFVLRFRGISIGISGYFDVLKNIISHHAIGKLFTQFTEVSWDQRIYIIISVVFYVVQVYQNIVACQRFYKNMYLIHDNIFIINTYLTGTAQNLEYLIAQTKRLPSYAAFTADACNKLDRMRELCDALKTVSPFKISFSKFNQIGYVMKYYYEFFMNEDIEELLQYSFGLNAYMEHLSSCKMLIESGHLNACEFLIYNDNDDEDEDQDEDKHETQDEDEDEDKDEDDEDKDENENEDETHDETQDEAKHEDQDEDEDQDKDETQDEDKNKDKNQTQNKESNKKQKPYTEIKNQYYPPLLNASPVKNTIALDRQLIITGPNAAGKTTLIKSTLFNIILSQQIGYGFYSSAKLLPYHYLHCYLNIPDTSGRDSLFQAESRRCKEILSCITTHRDKRHFCIFDELYSGTNPYEAIAAAYGYIDYVSKCSNVDLMLTTHYIELCKYLKDHARICNLKMDIRTINEFDFTYLYKVSPGISDIKGGVRVLHDLEYPDEIIESAKKIIGMRTKL